MTQRIVTALIFAGLMTVVASEEGDGFDTVPPPVSPISLKPAEPIPAGVKKVEPGTDLKAEPKPELKEEPKPEPKVEETSEPKVAVKTEMPVGYDRFKVLVQRNIFSKERGKPREESRRERKREAPPVPRIEADLVLIGVVQKDGVPAAIVENRVSGKIVTVKPGESIGAGVVKVISLDSIDFNADGILHVIKIGSTLAGTPPKSITTTSSETPPATTPAPNGTALPSPLTSSTTSTGPAAPASPAGSAGESVLERMRRKRQEELRK